MARSIIAVIVSYVTIFVLNFIGFVCLYMVVGPSQAFRPHSFLASNRWIGMSAVLVFLTAVIGGLICSAIAKGGRAPLALAVVVLVLGLLLAVPSVMKAKTNANLIRMGDVPQMEAAQKAYWPVWTPFTFPILGAIGVLIGGRLRKRS